VIDLKHMNSAETQVLQDLGAVWTSYGPALRDKFTLDGGMTWRKGVGGEFLYHYRVDPETGKKKWTALGLRSPATEATYKEFISRRGDDALAYNKAWSSMTIGDDQLMRKCLRISSFKTHMRNFLAFHNTVFLTEGEWQEEKQKA